MIYFLTITATLLAVSIFYQFASENYNKNLNQLFKENKYLEVINQLHTFPQSLLISNGRILILEVEAICLLKDKMRMEKLFETTKKQKLTYAQQVQLNSRLIQFYININENEKALASYHRLEVLAKEITSKEVNMTLENGKNLIEIYVNNNPNYYKVIKTQIPNCRNNEIKAVKYYQIAICFYLKKDFEVMIEYLDKASAATNSDSMKSEINKARLNSFDSPTPML